MRSPGLKKDLTQKGLMENYTWMQMLLLVFLHEYTIQAFWEWKLNTTIQKVFGSLFLKEEKKSLIHFNQFFTLCNDLAEINNERWELQLSVAISQFVSKYNLA